MAVRPLDSTSYNTERPKARPSILGRSLTEEGQETASQPRRLGCACSLPPSVLLIRAGCSRRSCGAPARLRADGFSSPPALELVKCATAALNRRDANRVTSV